MDHIEFKILKEYDSLTIKDFLKRNNVGRGKIEEIRNNHSVKVNSKEVNLDYILKKDDFIRFDIQEKINYKPYFKFLDVVYEDEYLVIVNKEAGMLIYSDNEEDITLVNLVAAYYYEHKIFRKVRYVHRIDISTSGIVIFAKDFLTQSILDYLISTHELKRYYLALCMNHFSKKEGDINLPISKDRHENNKYRVSNSEKSKKCLTHYEVIKTFKNYSLVRLLLQTGRTHQIRVHMSYINHPLLGDELYGGSSSLISRCALHSYKVKFVHPITHSFLECICPLHDDMAILTGGKIW